MSGRSIESKGGSAGRRQALRWFAPFAAALLLAGCATPRMEAQWRDPKLAAGALAGAAVLVVCRGPDLTLERICEDRLAEQAQAAGLHVLRLEPAREALPAGESLLEAARAARAAALLSMTVERAPTPPPTPAVGIGIGGATGGWGTRGGAAIGITLPIGGGAALSASASLTDSVEGRLLWSGRLRASGFGDEAEQAGEVARVTVEALQAARVF